MLENGSGLRTIRISIECIRGIRLEKRRRELLPEFLNRSAVMTSGYSLRATIYPVSFLPHVKIMKTDFADYEMAKQFDFPYVVLREPKPYDTTTLNYNWQIWETKAFSLYTASTDQIDKDTAVLAEQAVLAFSCKTEYNRV